MSSILKAYNFVYSFNKTDMKTIEIKSLADLSPILSRIEYLLEDIACYFSLVGENITMSNKEVIERLCVSESTLFRLRQAGTIPYTYQKGEITYKVDDIQKVINSKILKSRKLSTQEMLAQLYCFRENSILELIKK